MLRAALIGGFSLASLHFCWVLIVSTGVAQPILDWVFKLHMLNSPFQVQPFDVTLSALLIIVTFAIGCFYGVLCDLIRNLLFKQQS
jgi:hypothetical protein